MPPTPRLTHFANDFAHATQLWEMYRWRDGQAHSTDVVFADDVRWLMLRELHTAAREPQASPLAHHNRQQQQHSSPAQQLAAQLPALVLQHMAPPPLPPPPPSQQQQQQQQDGAPQQTSGMPATHHSTHAALEAAGVGPSGSCDSMGSAFGVSTPAAPKALLYFAANPTGSRAYAVDSDGRVYIERGEGAEGKACVGRL